MSVFDFLIAQYDYFMIVLLMGIGLYAMLAKRNLVKKLIGMNIFQTGIFLFYIEGAKKLGGTVPIIDEALGTDPDLYINPIPHVLMLTGIVVGISMSGVALAFLIRIYRKYGSLDDKKIMEKMKETAD